MKTRHVREHKLYGVCPVCGGKDKACVYCEGKLFALITHEIELNVSRDEMPDCADLFPVEGEEVRDDSEAK